MQVPIVRDVQLGYSYCVWVRFMLRPTYSSEAELCHYVLADLNLAVLSSILLLLRVVIGADFVQLICASLCNLWYNSTLRKVISNPSITTHLLVFVINLLNYTICFGRKGPISSINNKDS